METQQTTPGQRAYEQDRATLPLYHDGSRRPPWSGLWSAARWSWERDPTQRVWVRYEKLQRLLRIHREHAFDPSTGDAHCRAIVRLKRTQTWQAMMARNEGEARVRDHDRLARQGH